MMKFTFFFWLLFLCWPIHVCAFDPMLPQVYTEGTAISGWLMSEKLDGVRGYWDGERLFSKSGLPFYPPPAFLQDLPPFALEGELWAGRGSFEKTMSIVLKQYAHAGWLELKFAVFDVPQEVGGTGKRLDRARNWFKEHPSPFVFVIPQKILVNNDQLAAELHRIEVLGGEGVIVRNPNVPYCNGRTGDILKVKSFFDMEAVVIAHIAGKGRNRGRLGSLLVELSDKTRFKIGTGFSDAERENPPPVGSVITFKHYGFLKSGIPKFASFLRVRGVR